MAVVAAGLGFVVASLRIGSTRMSPCKRSSQSQGHCDDRFHFEFLLVPHSVRCGSCGTGSSCDTSAGKHRANATVSCQSLARKQMWQQPITAASQIPRFVICLTHAESSLHETSMSAARWRILIRMGFMKSTSRTSSARISSSNVATTEVSGTRLLIGQLIGLTL